MAYITANRPQKSDQKSNNQEVGFFLNGKIKPMYFKYLSAAFGSAMITSVYSIADAAMVGQYHGPQGTAALAVVAPVWNIIYGAGLATAVVRTYVLSFLLLPFNIFSTYYFQAIMKPKAAFVVSVARGFVISGILIMILPALIRADAIWFAMPITELVVMLYAAAAIRKYTIGIAPDMS